MSVSKHQRTVSKNAESVSKQGVSSSRARALLRRDETLKRRFNTVSEDRFIAPLRSDNETVGTTERFEADRKRFVADPRFAAWAAGMPVARAPEPDEGDAP